MRQGGHPGFSEWSIIRSAYKNAGGSESGTDVMTEAKIGVMQGNEPRNAGIL